MGDARMDAWMMREWMDRWVGGTRMGGWHKDG